MLPLINSKTRMVRKVITTMAVANKNAGKKNRNRNQKPLEVDDEAVARQVKETLARLTSKSQNKKGD